MRYVKTFTHDDNNQISVLAQKFNVSETFIKILFGREIDSEEKIYKFLNSNEQDLHNPHELSGIDKLIERVELAKTRNEKVVIFGDYDVDGICASYILYKHFTSIGINASCFLPHRIADGYGLTESAINEVFSRYNPNLIITVDCGISCKDEVEYAKSKGIDVIVTDHHDIPDEIPNCVVVNPKLTNQKYPFQKLCGAGVAFKVVEALSNRKNALKYVSIAAIATVADIVSLKDENRVIVKLGLNNIKQNIPIGLVKLADLCQIDKINAQSIAFKLAPKINAPGRLGDSSLVLDLFLETDEVKAEKIAEQIIDINLTRQELGQKIYNECIDKLKNVNLSKIRAIILQDDNWESGLLGIASAKLCNEFNRPVVLFANVENTLKGSGRSIPGINIVEAFKYSSSAILNYGGHELAGGLSIATDKFDEFKKLFSDFCSNPNFNTCFEKYIEYEDDIEVKDVNLKLIEELDKLEPIGCDNKSPLFKIKFNDAKVVTTKKDSEHMQIEISGKRFMAFSGIKFKPRLFVSGEKEAIVEVVKNEFRGKVEAKGFIKHISCKPSCEQFIYSGLLEKALITNYRGTYKFKALSVLPKPNFGTVYVTYFKNTAKFYSRNLGLKIEEFNAPDNTGESIILLAPLSADELKNFENIIFLDGVIKNFISKINSISNAEVFVLENAKFKYPTVSTNRNIFERCFKELKQIENANYYNFVDFYLTNINSFNGISFAQLMFAIKVFEELEFISVNFSPTKVNVKYNRNVKKQLNESFIYRRANYILESRKNDFKEEVKND